MGKKICTAQGCLLADVRVGGLEQLINFGRKIPSHVRGTNVAQSAKRKTRHILQRVLQLPIRNQIEFENCNSRKGKVE